MNTLFPELLNYIGSKCDIVSLAKYIQCCKYIYNNVFYIFEKRKKNIVWLLCFKCYNILNDENIYVNYCTAIINENNMLQNKIMDLMAIMAIINNLCKTCKNGEFLKPTWGTDIERFYKIKKYKMFSKNMQYNHIQNDLNHFFPQQQSIRLDENLKINILSLKEYYASY